MTHKERVKAFCKEQLQNLQLESYYSEPDFEHYYRKHKCASYNAFIAAIHIADFIIAQSHNHIKELQNKFLNLQIISNGTQS